MPILSQALETTLLRELAETQAVAPSQKWVLKAMQRHGHTLVRMLWRILGSEADVCDAYQNTFLQLAHCNQGCEPRNIRAYLFRTASNSAVSIIRKQRNHTKHLERKVVEDESNGKYIEVDQQDLIDSLRGYISQLPDHLRQVVVLRDLGELPYAKVARILGLSVGTARVYRCKALHLLAMWMNARE